MTNNQCSVIVWSKGDWHRHQCTRKGVNQEEGKWFCKQHTPSIIKAKDDKRSVERDKEYEEAKKKRERKDNMEQDLTDAINLLRRIKNRKCGVVLPVQDIWDMDAILKKVKSYE